MKLNVEKKDFCPLFPLIPPPSSPPPTHPTPHNPTYRITGGLPSLFHRTLLRIHSIASSTPLPFNALTGNTRLSLTPAPLSPSNTRRTNPSLMRTVSTQSSRSCLLASTRIGTPPAASAARTVSSTSLHSARRPSGGGAGEGLMMLLLSSSSPVVGFRFFSLPSPTSALSITNTMAWQLA